MTRHAIRGLSVRPLFFALAACCGLLVPAAVSTRAADPELDATWRTSDVTVDGSLADWARLERVGDGPAVAAQNDGRTLYLAIATNDLTVREQLAMGLVVWVDGTARKAQTFGLRLEGLTRRPLPGANPDSTTSKPFDQDLSLNTLDQFDLLGPARVQRRLIDDPAKAGIALALGVEDGMIVYELKLPLEKTDATPYAAGARPGSSISLGLATPEDPRPARSRNRLDDPTNTNPWVVNPYGYGGYFNPPPPPEPGAGSRPKPVVIKPMKLLWATVRLAATPSNVAP